MNVPYSDQSGETLSTVDLKCSIRYPLPHIAFGKHALHFDYFFSCAKFHTLLNVVYEGTLLRLIR